ncbi:hypothetical protein PAECIP112173_01655 [Paenibacillus sp. JJ-100]|uniref:hypothetical protein n=1 Tax=Paenibacillus sp. JJ-100 TaxID=2974896 RepID=UPI0022FF90E6|nr:hypothetical protein [Paenibacillus sp. JJ-100]CAI6057654.1 hypothetical protein PAECIP112173_01655 [Paenibacillus sp. JJ-100]
MPGFRQTFYCDRRTGILMEMLQPDGSTVTAQRNNEFPERLLEDYKLEEMLRSPHRFIRPEPSAEQRPVLQWRHRVQYAVSHAINYFYSVSPDVRKEIPIQYVLEKWWPRKTDGFDSILHYWDVKQKLIDELSLVVAANDDLKHPAILFEQWKTEVPSLQMSLSMIFHAAWQPDGWDNLLIQKYLVVHDANVVEAFQHMVSVFCWEAFGKLPGMIEVYCLLEGRKIRYIPGRQSLQRSMDYIRLVRDSMPKAEEQVSRHFTAKDRMRVHEEVDRWRTEGSKPHKTWLM